MIKIGDMVKITVPPRETDRMELDGEERVVEDIRWDWAADATFVRLQGIKEWVCLSWLGKIDE